MVASFLGLMLLQCGAEFRIWTDCKGRVFEAEYVSLQQRQLRLKDQGGRIHFFALDQLCEAGRTYVEEQIPPAVEIQVSVDVDRVQKPRTLEVVCCSGRVALVGSRNYFRELSGTLLILGEKRGREEVTVLAREEFLLSFPKGKGEGTFGVEEVYFPSARKGQRCRYSGYLVVLRDDQGRLVAEKSNRKLYRNCAVELMKLPVRTLRKKQRKVN